MTGDDHRRWSHVWFGKQISKAELKRRSVRGALVSGGSRTALQILQIGSFVVLARLLVTADFGLIAMITAVVGIADVLQDLGLSAATIRSKTINHAQVSNLFWINIGVGLLLGLLVATTSPLLQALYGDTRVQSATAIMSAGFILNGASTQHRALLRRAMRYADLARVGTWAAVVTTTVSISVAYYGGSYWALITGPLAGNAISLLLLWSFCDWRPGWPKRHVGTRPMAVFGLHLAVFGILAFVARHLHSLIIGRMWGAAETGIYGRASLLSARLTGNIVDPLRVVTPTALARLTSEPTAFSSYYYKSATLAVMAIVPIVFVGLVLPYDLVSVLLGDQWDRTGQLLRLMTIGVIPQVICGTSGWVYLSAGNSQRMMQWGVIGWSAVITGTVIGSFFGLEGIALASSITTILLVVPCQMFAFYGTALTLSALMRSVTKPIGAGLITGLICWAGLQLLPPDSSLIRLIAGSLSFVLIYALLLMTVFGQRPLILGILRQLKSHSPTPK